MKKTWVAFGLFTLLAAVVIGPLLRAETPAFSRDQSLAYFNKMAAVIQHQRCLNCHPGGNQPTQGMDMHIHIMNVQRGADNHGAVAAQCTTCHGTENNPTSGVPGAPKWGLAPKSMAWQGLSKHQICEQLKDTKRNGGKSLEDLIHHNGEDQLVAWGWNPGGTREPVPGTQKEFGENTKHWVETGAVCPD